MTGLRLLFLTWDGPEVAYLEGLFLPILAGLRAHGHAPHVLQFGWGPPARRAVQAEAAREAGVPYRALPVRRWRPRGASSVWSAIEAAPAIRRAARDWRIDAVMPRSLQPALAAMAAWPAGGPPLVFDADGLPADELVDFAGLSPTGATYRVLRAIEARAVRRAARVLVRTPAAAAILADRAGVGPDRFATVVNGRRAPADPPPAPPEALRPPGAPVLAYAGSLGPKYDPEGMLRFAAALRGRLPGLALRVFTPNLAELAQAQGAAGLADAPWIGAAHLAPEALPAALAACDAGLALFATTPSMRAVSPTKHGDYLLAGLPVIGTPGIGDTAPLEALGVFRPSDGRDAEAVADWLTTMVLDPPGALREASREAFRRHLSLDRAVAGYAAALEGVTGGRT